MSEDMGCEVDDPCWNSGMVGVVSLLVVVDLFVCLLILRSRRKVRALTAGELEKMFVEKRSRPSVLESFFVSVRNQFERATSKATSKVFPLLSKLASRAGHETSAQTKKVNNMLGHMSMQVSRTTNRNNPKLRVRNSDDWKLEAKEIKLGIRVAAGSFGEVYKGELYGVTVAVKCPSKEIPHASLLKFVEEVELMTKLHHPNIVVCLGACVEPGNMMLVLEYLERGSLFDFLQSKEAETVLTYGKVLKFAIDISRGMRYLHHRCKIIQRDLKSRNLLIDDSYNVKICDFGLSKVYEDEDQTLTACGTPYWAAPEVIMGEKYDEKADVFSFAIVLWELITREEPYDGKPGMNIAFAVAQEGLRPVIPIFVPDSYRNLMESCWVRDPYGRPGFPEILEILHEMGSELKMAPMIQSS